MNSGAFTDGRAIILFAGWPNNWAGWQRLMVNSGLRWPGTTTTFVLKGIALNSKTTARIELTADRCVFERDSIILARVFLKQRPVVFQVRRLDIHSLPAHLNRQLYWHA